MLLINQKQDFFPFQLRLLLSFIVISFVPIGKKNTKEMSLTLQLCLIDGNEFKWKTNVFFP